MQDQVEKWLMVLWVRDQLKKWGGIALSVIPLTWILCLIAKDFAGYVRPRGAQVFIEVCAFAISFCVLVITVALLVISVALLITLRGSVYHCRVRRLRPSVTTLTGILCIIAVNVAGFVRPLGAKVFIDVCACAISFITVAGAILNATTQDDEGPGNQAMAGHTATTPSSRGVGAAEGPQTTATVYVAVVSSEGVILSETSASLPPLSHPDPVIVVEHHMGELQGSPPPKLVS